MSIVMKIIFLGEGWSIRRIRTPEVPARILAVQCCRFAEYTGVDWSSLTLQQLLDSFGCIPEDWFSVTGTKQVGFYIQYFKRGLRG